MVDKSALDELNQSIYDRGNVDREHLLEFLRLVPTNDARVVADEVRNWLQTLNDDPKYDKIAFPRGDIDAIITDLASYERLRPDTLHHLRQPSNRELPVQ